MDVLAELLLDAPLFRDRADAGGALAAILPGDLAPQPVAVGLAHGGVEVATEVGSPSVPKRAVLGHFLVGVDDTDACYEACRQATVLLEPDGVLELVTVVDAALSHVHLRTPFAEEIDAPPAEALCRTAAGVDLLVVGSRGLHGARTLGSVSENVARQAGCSVLVVRRTT